MGGKITGRPVRLALSGYYGFGNSGDEAVLQSILQALDQQGRDQGVRIEPVVLSARPDWTSSAYGVRAAHRMRPQELFRTLSSCDGLISGGGSLLQDATSSRTIPYYLAVLKLAQWLGKPTFVYAQGIGPVERPLFHRMIASVLRRCSYVSVRDAESAALLERMGLDRTRIEVVPDPVMGMKSEENSVRAERLGGKSPVLGVSVRYWRSDRQEIGQLAEALDAVLGRTNAHVRLLPFHLPSDREASEELRNRMAYGRTDRVSLAPDLESPLEMFEEVGRCDALIGMRLHSLIYAAAQTIPVLGISYDPKIDQFLRRLGEEAVGSTDSLDAERVALAAERLLADKAHWQREKSPLVEALKIQAQQPAREIVSFYKRENLKS